MGNSAQKYIDQLCTGVGVASVLFLSVALGQRALAYAGSGREIGSKVIRVTGVHVPADEADGFVVYSDAGEFTVADRVVCDAADPDPLLLFSIGQTYSVETKGEEFRTLLGPVHPEITSVRQVASGVIPKLSYSQ